MNFLKSLVFNIAFYIYTAFCCFVLTFAFLLPRRAAFLFVQTLYFKGIVWVERIFLGLDYHVSGRENLPKEGSYILAVKHYSMYETLKMPVIFGDIAIILKRELTYIPFWGWYTIKTGMIPVDRGAGGKALASLLEGGRRVVAQGRPILIFPQGTRVDPGETPAQKPYKIGIGKIAETLQLPVVPVALNSAAFWPKRSFIKKSGIVDFKILPPLPAGLSAAEILKKLQEVLEPESQALMANPKIMQRGGTARNIVLGLLLLFALWAAWWHYAAHALSQQLALLPQEISSPFKPSIEGFPGAMQVLWPEVIYQSPSGSVTFPVVDARVWPLPAGRAEITAPKGFTLNAQNKDRPVQFTADDFTVRLGLPAIWQSRDAWDVHIKDIYLRAGETELNGEGDIATPVYGAPVNGALNMRVAGYAQLLDILVNDGLMEKQNARMIGALFDTMMMAQGSSGTLRFPLSIKDDVIYASMFRVFSLADLRAPGSAQTPQKIRSGDLATDDLLNPAPQTTPRAPQP